MEVPLIKFKIDLQQLEAIASDFLPYMEMLCSTEITNTQDNEDDNLKAIILQANFNAIDGIISTWMINPVRSVHYEFRLSLGVGITFYYLLRKLPINVRYQYLNDLKDHLITIIESQVWDDIEHAAQGQISG